MLAEGRGRRGGGDRGLEEEEEEESCFHKSKVANSFERSKLSVSTRTRVLGKHNV